MRNVLRGVVGSSLVAVSAFAVACDDDAGGGSGGTGATAGVAGSAGTGGSSGSSGEAGSAGTSGASGAGGADGGTETGPFDGQLPVTADSNDVTGLRAPVNVVRDRNGMTHIYARHVEDAFRVQGYRMASDRHVQIELVRRSANGRLSELLGGLDQGTIDQDIVLRTVGLRRVAQQIYDAMPQGSEMRRVLDAFADGITQYFRKLRDGSAQLPGSYLGFAPSVFEDFTAVDALAFARLQTFALSYDGVKDAGVLADREALESTFSLGATEPWAVLRDGAVRDLLRFDPLVPAAHMNGFPDSAPLPAPKPAPRSAARRRAAPPLRVDAAVRETVRSLAATVQRAKDLIGGDVYAGSNNWAVSGAKSATGHAMVAGDSHLGLNSPMIFWPTHLVVRNPSDAASDLDISGLAFTGIPGVILGGNRELAWTATVTAFDVTDNYQEVVSADGSGVVFKGQTVPFQKIRETLKIGGTREYTWDVLIVPHHGPVQPQLVDHAVVAPAPNSKIVSVRWTGHEPTQELESVRKLWRTKTVDEARVAMSTFGTGSQNWTVADSKGDILTYAPARLPFRDARTCSFDPSDYSGTTPNFMFDGASGDFEWTGEYLPEKYIPKEKSPAKGWVATANGDHIGTSFDANPCNERLPDGRPFYLQGEYDIGYRIGRIQERLTELTRGDEKVDADEMSALQGDHQSPLGRRLVPAALAAWRKALAEHAVPGTHADLGAVVADPRFSSARLGAIIELLERWGTTHDFSAKAGLDLEDGSLNVPDAEAEAARATSVFNVWMSRVLAISLGDEFTAAGVAPSANQRLRAFVRLVTADPTSLATYDAALGESWLWDDLTTPVVVESSSDRMTLALLDTLEALERHFGTADVATWRWGDLHRVVFQPLIPLWPIRNPENTGAFAKGFPRHGDQSGVDASNPGLDHDLTKPLSFNYTSGPIQRYVATMTPTGPVIRNALPGGAQMFRASPFFSNEAELWRKNQTHRVPVSDTDVVSDAVAPGGEHVRYR